MLMGRLALILAAAFAGAAWARLHAARTALGVAAVLAYLWALN